MTKSKRLEPVTRVAESRERQAAVEMVEFRRFLDAQQARLTELSGYRADYAQRFEQAGRQGLDAARAADFRRILARLGEAIAFQEQRLASLQQDYERIRCRWTDSRSRAAALDKVMQRYRSEERQVADRLEQGELDERSLRAYQDRPGSGDT
jgi:flagellar FliJ protein